jgi:hypothetical protein
VAVPAGSGLNSFPDSPTARQHDEAERQRQDIGEIERGVLGLFFRFAWVVVDSVIERAKRSSRQQTTRAFEVLIEIQRMVLSRLNCLRKVAG